MMVAAHYYLTEKEEVVEGSKEEEYLVAKGHIPQAVTALMEVFGNDQTDRFHMLARKGGIHLA